MSWTNSRKSSSSASQKAEDPESLWIRVTSPEDEDRRSELIEYACDKTMDILMDYGYHMLVMPTRQTV